MRAPRFPFSLLAVACVVASVAHAEQQPTDAAEAVAARAEAAAIAAPAGPGTAPQDAVSPQSQLTGREIYECVLDNRFESYVQSSKLVSGDRGKDQQESKLKMTWRSFRDENGEPDGDVMSKTIVKYTDPFDLRYSGYLIVSKKGTQNDQFVYLNTTRRIRRVNLRREAVFGTDFSFEDVVPREIEDSDYQRLPDSNVDGVPVYVVEIVPKEHTNSEYSKFHAQVEKEHCVPLKNRYWDDRGVEVKELTANPQTIRQIDDVWLPFELTMRNLQLDTFTTLDIEELEPNLDLPRKVFDLRRLESH